MRCQHSWALTSMDECGSFVHCIMGMGSTIDCGDGFSLVNGGFDGVTVGLILAAVCEGVINLGLVVGKWWTKGVSCWREFQILVCCTTSHRAQSIRLI